VNHGNQIDQRKGGQKDALHLAKEARAQKRAELKIERRTQRHRTSHERQEKQGA
jgi:hypothetical protein